jgi:hypothetical protein
MMEPSDRSVRITRLSDQGADADLRATTTPAERIGMMWQLAMDAWAFMGEPLDDTRLRRDIVRLVRRKR